VLVLGGRRDHGGAMTSEKTGLLLAMVAICASVCATCGDSPSLDRMCSYETPHACWRCGECSGLDPVVGCREVGECATFCSDCFLDTYSECAAGDARCAGWSLPRPTLAGCRAQANGS